MEAKEWERELAEILEKNMSPEDFFWSQMEKRNLKIDVDTIDILLVYLVQVKEIELKKGLQIHEFTKKCIKNHLIKGE
jgi:hypothetical protein